MITFAPFEAEHVFKLRLQYAQDWAKPYLKLAEMRSLEGPWAVTLFDEGKPVLCAGVAMYWADRAMVWSFLGDVGVRNFIQVHNMARGYVDRLPFRRLEASVDVGFRAGHRWVKALGFRLEAECMRAYNINGADCALYAKVRG